MKRYNLGDIVAAGMNETLESESFKKIFAKAPVPAVKVAVAAAPKAVPAAVTPELDAFEKLAQFALADDKDEDDKDDKDDEKKDKPKKGKLPPWLQKGKKKKDDEDDEEESEKEEKEEKDEDDNDIFDMNFAKDKKEKEDKDEEEEDEEEEEEDEDEEKKEKEDKKDKNDASDTSCSCVGGPDTRCPAHRPMYASALRHIVETLNKTSAVLDTMNLERSSVATLNALETLVREAMVKIAEGGDELDEPEDLGLESEDLGLEPEDSGLESEDELANLRSRLDEAEESEGTNYKPRHRYREEPANELSFESESDLEPEDELIAYPMEPEEELNFSDDYVSPNQLKSSIDPKLEDCADCGDEASLVQAFNALENWIKKDSDLDTL